jgi:hypothetical protein
MTVAGGYDSRQQFPTGHRTYYVLTTFRLVAGARRITSTSVIQLYSVKFTV